jgi:lipopolysaccharide transport system permease protein
MLVMTAVFGRVAGLPHEGTAPYAVMVFAAMLPWQFVSTAISAAGQSIVTNSNLVSKVYFPRLIVPLSSIGVAVADLLVSLSILAALMVWFLFAPTWRIAALPFLILLAVIAAIGPSLLITALTVRYRDVRFVVPFLVQFGLYASPVAYSTSVVYDKAGPVWFFFYSLNPMVGVIDGFRWSVIGDTGSFHSAAFVTSLVVSAMLFVAGILYFRKTERAFADII